MSLTSALNIAQSGLSATGRRAQIASSNIANVNTPGYVRRSVSLVDMNHGGVAVWGIERHQNAAISAARRDAQSATARSQLLSDVSAQLLQPYGDPNSPGGLQSDFDNMRSGLETLRNTPESIAAQENAVAALTTLVSSINAASNLQSDIRSQADQAIAADVDTANSILNSLHDLNGDILSSSAAGADASTLLDQRDNLLGELSNILPISVQNEEGGRIRVTTQSGLTLVGSEVTEIEFSPVGRVYPGDTPTSEGGRLSIPTIGGQPIGPGSGPHAVHEGRFGAQLHIRDTLIPAQVEALDSFAFDLADSFQQSGAALMLDGANPVDATQKTGLAARLTVNPAIDPEAGGEPFRLRDGIGAVSPGSPGADTRLDALVTAASAATSTFASLVDGVSSTAFRNERVHVGNVSRETALIEGEAAQSGVDMDFELQSLIAIEQSYSANARVIQSVSDMFDALLRI